MEYVPMGTILQVVTCVMEKQLFLSASGVENNPFPVVAEEQMSLARIFPSCYALRALLRHLLRKSCHLGFPGNAGCRFLRHFASKSNSFPLTF